MIESKFISIPNVVVDSKISNDSKVLYGLIRYYDYIHDIYKSIDSISEDLNVSKNTARKCLKELEQVKFIDVRIINNNKRYIIPLVSDGIMIESSINNRKHNEEQQRKENILKADIPGEVKAFFDAIGD